MFAYLAARALTRTSASGHSETTAVVGKSCLEKILRRLIIFCVQEHDLGIHALGSWNFVVFLTFA